MKTFTTLAALIFVAACGSKPSNPPSTPPAANAGADAGSTSTTSGSVIDEPNSPNMTNSGTPNPPGRGDPPQLIPPELAPK